MHRIVLGFFLLTACGHQTPEPKAMTGRTQDTASSVPVRKPATSSSGPIAITQATLISDFVATQAEIDSSPDESEALSDYQYYLSRVTPVLERAGIVVKSTNDSVVRLKDRLGVHTIQASDSGGILYLFALPNGRSRALRDGVHGDDDILAIARDHFGLVIPDSQADSVTQ